MSGATEATAWLVALGLCGVALPALADDASAAEALFRAGRDAFKSGDYAAACAQFRESNHLEPAAGTELNLAVCEEKRGRLATAWEAYQAALHALAVGDPRLALARERARQLEPSVPMLTLVASGTDAADAVVDHDGSEFTHSSFGIPIPMDPGLHTFTVRVAGHAARRYTLLLAAGDRLTLRVEPGPAWASRGEAARQADQAAPQPSGAARRTWGILALGAAGSALAVGTVSGIGTLRKKSTMNHECDARGACTREGLAAADSADTLSTVSTIAFVSAALGVGLGTYLLWTLPGTAPREPSSHAALSLDVNATRSGALLVVKGETP